MTESERALLKKVMQKSYDKLDQVELTDHLANTIWQLYMALNLPRDKNVVLAIMAGHMGVAPPEVQMELKPTLTYFKEPRGELGDALFDDRWERAITQKEYAALLGVREGLYSYWERGEGVPNITHLQAISETLKVEVAELIRMVRDFVSPHMRKKTGGGK